MRRIGSLVVGFLLTGCYSMEPVGGSAAPQPGTELAWDINDAGRVALGGTMGPEIAQVEGRLVEKDNTEYVVAVSVVHLLRGGEQTWRGEHVRIKQEYVTSMYEKRFSKVRSIAAGAVTVAVVALVATRSSLIGLGSAEPGKTPSDTGQSVRRPVRR